MKERKGAFKRGFLVLALLALAIIPLLVAGGRSAQAVGSERFRLAEPGSVDAPSMVLIIQDKAPWSSTSIQDILTANTITYDTITSSQIGATDLPPYFMVILPSDQEVATYNNWNANFAKIDAYVKAGGLLWMSAANQLGQPEPKIPGGVIGASDFESFNDVAAFSHPWISGVPSAMGSYTSTSHDSFTNLYPNSLVVVTERSSGKPTLIDYKYGYGRVLANGMTLEWAHKNGYMHGPILPNSLLNMVSGANLNVAGMSFFEAGSQITSIGAVGSSTINWSLDAHTGGGYAVGDWAAYPDFGCNNATVEGAAIIFNADGTLSGAALNWTWTQDRNQIVWTNNAGTTYSGYVAGDFMGGTMFSGGSLGCWEATRIPADEASETAFLAQEAGEAALTGQVDVGSGALLLEAPDLDAAPEPDVSEWLTVTPDSGSVGANKRANITVQVAADPDFGSHFGLVRINTNDPDKIRTYMPVSLPSPGNYLPLSLKNACGGVAGGREIEPNNSFGAANPICFDIPLKGSPNDASPADEFDYFAFEWDTKGSVAIDLTNFVPGGQLILYRETVQVKRDYIPGPGNSYQVTYGGGAGPGTYQILVLAGANHPTNTGDYTLSLTKY